MGERKGGDAFISCHLPLPKMGAGTAEKGAGTQQQLLPRYLLCAIPLILVHSEIMP